MAQIIATQEQANTINAGDAVTVAATIVRKIFPELNRRNALAEVEQLVEHNARTAPQAMEYRSLGDSPAVGVIIYPGCGAWEWRPAPEFTPTMHYVHTGANRPIRVYSDIDSRFILEDFFAKLRRFTRIEKD